MGKKQSGAFVLLAIAAMLLAFTPPAHGVFGSTELVSGGGNGAFDASYIGPKGGNRSFYFGESRARWYEVTPLADGSDAFFATRESLDAADTDANSDIYHRSGAMTSLVTTGPTGGNGAFHVCQNPGVVGGCGFVASLDGGHAFFNTAEALVPTDLDTYVDIYDRASGSTAQVTTSATAGNGPYPTCIEAAGFPCRFGISADGQRVFWATREPLVPQDTDSGCGVGSDPPGCVDIYERSSGTTTLLSTGPTGGNGNRDAFLEDLPPFAVSLDGDHVFFRTLERLTSGDTDFDQYDIYESNNGVTKLVSTNDETSYAFSASWLGASADGTRAFFETAEPLVAEDLDGALSVYERSNGTTKLIPTGPAGTESAQPIQTLGPSYDGDHFFFATAEQLVPEDTDSNWDLYDRSGNTTKVVSIGPNGGNGAYDVCRYTFNTAYPCMAGASRDGEHVFFATQESLTSEDNDNVCPDGLGGQRPCIDVYERFAGTTRLVSTGPLGPVPWDYLNLSSVSADGRRVTFTSFYPFVPEDSDGFTCSGRLCQDVYQRHAGRTTLVSVGPIGGNGPHDAFFGGASADGKTIYFNTGEQLTAGDLDGGEVDVYVARATAGPPAPYDAPAAASPLIVSLVPELRQTISTAQCQARGGTPSSHGSPLALTSCNPPAYVPGTAAHLRGQGTAELAAVEGDFNTPADEADLALSANLTDVRTSGATPYLPNPSGSDVTLVVKLRLTDTLNGPSQSDPATAADFELTTPADCAVAASIGSTCAVSTSVDSLTPGAIKEGRNMILQAFRVRMHDSGPNGLPGDADDKKFASQGIYVP